MNTASETLSANEAASAAGVSIADVNRVVDRNILPNELFSASGSRSFRKEACVFISFYFGTADSLTSAARIRAIRDGLNHMRTWAELKTWKSKESAAVEVTFSPFMQQVEDRLKQLQKAQHLIVEDPEVFRGTPIFRGTRIPVHHVADLVEAGTPMEELRELYPRLHEEHFALAPVYAKAHPKRGRPVRRSIPKSMLISVSKRPLKAAGSGGEKRDQTSRR